MVSPVTAARTGADERTGPGGSDKAGGARRVPLRAQSSKSDKHGGNADKASQVPAYIRAVGIQLSSSDRAHIRSKLGLKLGKFAPAIERVSVRVRDMNGPRGGIDKACRIKVVIAGLPSILFESRDASLIAAVNGALSGVERTVRRVLQRRQTRLGERVA
jgi:ribosome-associated translation inhibitor RaiA